MRQTAVLLTILILAPGLLARPKQDWGRVEKLKPGARVVVVLASGGEMQGRVKSVSTTDITLITDLSWKPLQEFARDDIRKITHIRGPRLPDPERWMRDGALIGGAVGVTAGAIQDIAHGNNGRFLTEGLGGAGVGFFASCAALAGVGVLATVRHDKVVYETTDAPHRLHRSPENAGSSTR